MNSISRRLTLWILSGLVLLWATAGTGIYWVVRQGLLKSLDAELALDSRSLRFAYRGDERSAPPFRTEEPLLRMASKQRIRDQLLPYYTPSSGSYFQSWNGMGEVLEKSPSLQSRSLAIPSKISPKADLTFVTTSLPDGTKVRQVNLRALSGNKGKPRDRKKNPSPILALAKETKEMDQTLRLLLTGIITSGVAGGLFASLLVRTALHFGMAPLHALGTQLSALDAYQLDLRFPQSRFPEELRPIVDRLNQLIERLEASFTRERRFSADLAHELRTPIAELKTLSEVALKWPDQAGDKTHQETLLIAQDLESVVVTLLTLARWESGDHPIKWEPMILATLLRDSWAPFEAKAEDRGLLIQWDLGQDEATSPYRTDPAILRHILTNLFSNAVEYAPSQTIINVHQSEHELIVTNQAPHLTEDDLAHLFDRHWRADPARTSLDTPHTGLGLALAKACADALGTPLKAQLHEGLLSFRLQLTPPSSEEGATPPYPET